MECNVFWEKISRFLAGEKKFDEDMQGHLVSCKKCSDEYSLINDGLKALKNEVASDEPARFWHDMKEKVRDGVKIRRPWFAFRRWWRLSWIPAGALSVALAIGIIHYKKPIQYTDPEIMLLAGANPEIVFNLDEDIVLSDTDGSNGVEDPAVYAGITDEWSSVIMEEYEGNHIN